MTVVDIQLGIGNTSTSGCEAGDFAGFPAGNIALIQRGTCTFEIKGENAAAAGAVGILFFNQGNTAAPDRNGIPAVTLSDGYTGGIPALNLTYALGATLSATAGLQVRLFANVTRELSTTENLIAESRRGDPHNVIMAGAHLDSVPAGPGINDNGSGASALIEVAEQMAKLRLPNQLRFAWWGAEEDGLVGSTRYVASLTEDDLADLEMYLNFDMIASPNYGLFIYDGDGSGFGLVGPDGSDDIEALFERYFAERDIPSEPTAFSGRSDYQAFINNGVPSGGLFTGAEVPKTAAQAEKWGGTVGVAYDPCYHAACDTIDNVNHDGARDQRRCDRLRDLPVRVGRRSPRQLTHPSLASGRLAFARGAPTDCPVTAARAGSNVTRGVESMVSPTRPRAGRQMPLGRAGTRLEE